MSGARTVDMKLSFEQYDMTPGMKGRIFRRKLLMHGGKCDTRGFSHTDHFMRQDEGAVNAPPETAVYQRWSLGGHGTLSPGRFVFRAAGENQRTERGQRSQARAWKWVTEGGTCTFGEIICRKKGFTFTFVRFTFSAVLSLRVHAQDRALPPRSQSGLVVTAAVTNLDGSKTFAALLTTFQTLHEAQDTP